MQKKEVCDVSNLAEVPDLSSYNRIPVQNYGMNLLRRMGFQQSTGIGKRKQNQLLEPLVLKPRPKGLGLGAQQQKQQQQIQLVSGDYVKITSEPHSNLDAIVLDVEQEQCFVQLLRSKAKLKINIKNLKKITPQQIFKFDCQIKQQNEQKKKRRLKWVIPQIRVKIIDKQSILYLKKVIITDILSDKQFECRTDDGKIIHHLTQKQLQTVLPKPGSLIMILRGNKIGQKAKLLQRNKSKNTVMVQTLEQLQIINVDEDDVSQYIQL